MKPSTTLTTTLARGLPATALILLASSLALLALISGHSHALESSAASNRRRLSSSLDDQQQAAKGGRFEQNSVGDAGAIDDNQNKSDERHSSSAVKSQSKRETAAAANKRDPSSSSQTSSVALASIGEPHGLESSAKSSIASAVEANEDLAAAAGHHYGKSHGGGHGKYYMYVESPKKGAYKMGFRRGNHKHMIERKESAHKSHVHSYFKWHDKKGKGSHKFEFKHGGHKKKHGGHY